jgi:poly(3-hydroxybutyrate) depolymerase
VPTLLVDRDYGRDQSQLISLRDGGLDRPFAIDWLAAADETGDWSIEGYVAVLEEAVQFLGGRVNLVGDCQGGRLAVSTPAYTPST